MSKVEDNNWVFEEKEEKDYSVEISSFDRVKPVGVSGLLRIKNDADFVAESIDSCIEALNELGYSVPDDIWVCGFDDSQEASYFAPRLTSIHIHEQIMGYTAANLLMTRIEEPSLNYRTVYTETNLILRESTGD